MHILLPVALVAQEHLLPLMVVVTQQLLPDPLAGQLTSTPPITSQVLLHLLDVIRLLLISLLLLVLQQQLMLVVLLLLLLLMPLYNFLLYCNTIRTFTAVDGCGNSATTSRSVTWTSDLTPNLQELIPPVTLGCNPTAADITAALGSATATDACGAI